jgi:hypothetical protein
MIFNIFIKLATSPLLEGAFVYEAVGVGFRLLPPNPTPYTPHPIFLKISG